MAGSLGLLEIVDAVEDTIVDVAQAIPTANPKPEFVQYLQLTEQRPRRWQATTETLRHSFGADAEDSPRTAAKKQEKTTLSPEEAAAAKDAERELRYTAQRETLTGVNGHLCAYPYQCFLRKQVLTRFELSVSHTTVPL